MVSARQSETRRGSVYLAVTGTAILVSLIGLTSLHLSRLELDSSISQSDRAYARHLAHSGVEFAMGAIDVDPSWRSNYTHGQESTRDPIGTSEDIVFRFLDNTDGNLANDSDQEVEIEGIGRYGNAEFRYSVTYAPSVSSEQQVATVVASYDSATDAEEEIDNDAFVGQHFVANLPAGVMSWSVTSIDIYLSGHGAANGTLNVNFYNSDGSGHPNTLIETVSVAENTLPDKDSPDWHGFAFSSVTGLSPSGGYSVTLEGAGGGKDAIARYDTGVTQTDSHLVRGGWGSWTPSTGQSLRYRINGVYTTSVGTGPFTITPGSWKRVGTP